MSGLRGAEAVGGERIRPASRFSDLDRSVPRGLKRSTPF